MVEIYFTIKTVLLVIALIFAIVYVAYELWRWFR